MIKELDPMDKYSKPKSVVECKLGRLFAMESRRNPQKPGRELVVAYDRREPLIEGFETRYSYYVRFFKQGNWAGNHYHEVKEELFIPITGEFRVLLGDVDSGEQEELTISSDRHEVFYVKPRVAHKVIAMEPDSVLLVMATSPNSQEDEYHYKIDL